MRITAQAFQNLSAQAPAQKSSQATADVNPELAKLRESAQGIEAIFIKDLLSAMRRSVPKTSFGQTMGAGMYEEMLDQALAENASKRGTFGIAKLLERQLAPKLLQEAEARQRQG
jgi:peptidoglycan hydrolase FlgJ